jgi:4-amino-4-deoxy-L-arabinose transferase-like glycosyltransferase
MRWQEILPLGLLLLGYLALATLFAVRTPAWQAPDEPAHYNYVRQLAGGGLPVIAPGDWDQAYLSQVVGAEFDPAYSVDRLTYEDWQPPLYYLLQVPVYRLSGGSQTAMRLLSILFGAGVVVLAYVIGRAVFDGNIPSALAVAAFVAFLPQHLAILGSVNNDSLAELIIAAILALLVIPWPEASPLSPPEGGREERLPRGRLLALGLLLGAGFLTKGTVYLMAPVVGVFLLVRYWPRPDRSAARGSIGQETSTADLSGLFKSIIIVFAPALLFGLLLWGRNAAVYGGLDVLARAAHDEVVVGQPRTAEWIAQYGLGGTIGRFLRTTFTSFWGQFGWMAAPLPGWIVGALAVVTVIAAAGLLLAFADHRRQMTESGKGSVGRGQKPLQVLVLGLTFLLTLALHVGYNLTFVQHQGRYLFPALIPIAVGFTAGLGYWLRPVVRRWPWAGYLLPLGIAALLGGISLFALWRILPGLAPG